MVMSGEYIVLRHLYKREKKGEEIGPKTKTLFCKPLQMLHALQCKHVENPKACACYGLLLPFSLKGKGNGICVSQCSPTKFE